MYRLHLRQPGNRVRLFWLAWILFTTLYEGAAALRPSCLRK